MEQRWSRVLDISLNGFFNVTQPLLKNMLVKRFGRIINIVSLSGIKGMPGQTNYSAAKGGIIAATKALAQEVAKKTRDGKCHSTGIYPYRDDGCAAGGRKESHGRADSVKTFRYDRGCSAGSRISGF